MILGTALVNPNFSFLLMPLIDVFHSIPHEVIPYGFFLLGSSIFGIDVSGLLGDSEEEEISDDDDDNDSFFDEPTEDSFGEESGLDEDDSGEMVGQMGGMTESNEVDEVKDRVDELEKEIEQISSTIGTVRSENEEISGSVESVEENVRKLLEVYELVTNEINPFVDEADEAGFDPADFDIFSDDPGDPITDRDEEAIDEGSGVFGESANEASSATKDEDAKFEFEQDASSDEDEDTRTFEDVKSEYESTDEELDESDLLFDSEVDSDDEDDNTSDSTRDGDEDVKEQPVTDSESTGTTDRSESDSSVGSGGSPNPYLTELPSGYGTEIIVFEWMTYLHRIGGLKQANQALRYYQNLGWISKDVAMELRDVLRGLPTDGLHNGIRADGSGNREITITHHKMSLSYIDKLTDNEFSPNTFELTEGGNYGI